MPKAAKSSDNMPISSKSTKATIEMDAKAEKVSSTKAATVSKAAKKQVDGEEEEGDALWNDAVDWAKEKLVRFWENAAEP